MLWSVIQVAASSNDKYAVFEVDMGHRRTIDPIAPPPKRLEVKRTSNNEESLLIMVNDAAETRRNPQSYFTYTCREAEGSPGEKREGWWA